MAIDQAGADGVTRIVEVGAKPETAREAVAEAWLVTTPEAVGASSPARRKGRRSRPPRSPAMIGVKRTPTCCRTATRSA